MSKYDKFGDFLRNEPANVIEMGFSEIEAILGVPLPPSKVHPAWWSNSPWNNVMTRVWLDAGFKSSKVDVQAERVTFVRAVAPVASIPNHPTPVPERAGAVPRSPLFGCMKGTSIVMPGVDLTEPADPDWGRVYDENQLLPAEQYIVDHEGMNTSEKIRELNALGVPRAEIAKALGKRYQHVRNVLTAKRKAG